MATSNPPSLLTLPSEIIYQVLSFLSLPDVLSFGRTNRAFYVHSLEDTLYHRFVQDHVPGTALSKPAHSTWRDLYISHHPFWFIPQGKIWFADKEHTGKLLVARYDARKNAIEAYPLVAERRQPTFLTWESAPNAVIHTFSPRIQLDLNAPVVRLDAVAYENTSHEAASRLQNEIPMDVSRPTARLFSRLMLTTPWPTAITRAGTPVWPPLILPSCERTRTDSPSHFRGLNHRPDTLARLSKATFRTRTWMEFPSRINGVNVRLGEDVTTWATLPEECYTPTPLKPWQGIWCGDYAGHGCEFVAIIQPDDPQPLPEKAALAMGARERSNSITSADSWSTAPDLVHDGPDTPEPDDLEHSLATLPGPADAAGNETNDTIDGPADEEEIFSDPDCVAHDKLVYRGRLEAIKLTGDPNIPRGEYTFIAPDIGPDGLIRVATDDMFRGARIVKSVGHIAARGFRDDNFEPSQLILISHDRMAQYWETFGHVAFYQRVNIDEFTKVS